MGIVRVAEHRLGRHGTPSYHDVSTKTVNANSADSSRRVVNSLELRQSVNPPSTPTFNSAQEVPEGDAAMFLGHVRTRGSLCTRQVNVTGGAGVSGIF